jgi:hypothetical protein|nr:MAG TPA: Poxvirus virion envelope protein A14 [Caudoviricetes sp.]
MSNEIIKVLDHLCDRFGIAIDWSSNNVMPYLQDLMVRITKYVIYTNILWLVISILIIGATVFALVKIIKVTRENRYDWDFIVGISSLIGSIIIIIFFLTGMYACQNLIEVNTVPEKYIIEMIRNDVSDNN